MLLSFIDTSQLANLQLDCVTGRKLKMQPKCSLIEIMLRHVADVVAQ